MNPTLNLSTGPHIRNYWTTRYIMYIVVLSLLPAAAVGVIVYGLRALWVILASVATAVLSELLFDLICKKPNTWTDGSAIVTGLMLALTLSPSVPLYVPIIGAAFAIIVVKCCFGGLGKNFVNPALAARCFLLISFPGVMTNYALDGVSSATPVAALKVGETVDVTKMFLGAESGVIGSSVLAILVGGLILWSIDVIHGQISFSVIISFTLFIALFGGQGFDPTFLAAHLCGGGVMLGAFYMATDYATSPVSRLGQTIFGVLIGVLGALFRVCGNSADSFSYSIIIANLFVPLIDTYIVSKPYAFRKKAIKLQNGETPKPFFKSIPKPVITLGVIALIAGLALSGVFTMTKDTIAEHRAEEALQAYKTVLPEAFTFHAIDLPEGVKGEVYGEEYGRTFINEAVEAHDPSGNLLGYAVSATCAEGYSGNVTLSVGVHLDGIVEAISFTELKETPGKGMLCDEPAFKDQFGKKDVTAFKLFKDGGATAPDEIDGVSGATISSKAVVNAVNAALDFCQGLLKEGK